MRPRTLFDNPPPVAILVVAVIASVIFGCLIAGVMLVNVRMVWLVIGFLATAAVALLGFIILEEKRDRNNFEQASAPRAADSAGDDLAVSGTCCDSQTAGYARVLDEARRGER